MDLSKLNANARETVNHVMARIAESNPQDAERIRRLVRAVIPYEGDDESCRGQWVRDPELDEQRYDIGEEMTGIVHILETGEHLPAILAHELGHACTTHDDLWDQRFSPTDEWSSEAAANRYAYLWGFGEELKRVQETTDLFHNGPRPGEWAEMYGIRVVCTEEYLLTQDDTDDGGP